MRHSVVDFFFASINSILFKNLFTFDIITSIWLALLKLEKRQGGIVGIISSVNETSHSIDEPHHTVLGASPAIRLPSSILVRAGDDVQSKSNCNSHSRSIRLYHLNKGSERLLSVRIQVHHNIRDDTIIGSLPPPNVSVLPTTTQMVCCPGCQPLFVLVLEPGQGFREAFVPGGRTGTKGAW